MTPIKQDMMHDIVSVGNCYQACIASLLDLPMASVPHFCNDYGQKVSFPLNFKLWLQERGLTHIEFSCGEDGLMDFWGYHLICGASPRGNWLHSIVGFNGDPIFDPHPSNDMLLPESHTPWVYTFIFPRRG